jgi:thiol-disulfide isomerase/thioredoxin
VFIFAILIANKELIQEGFFNSEKKFSFEYYYMDTCGHCRDFNETGHWDKLNTQTFNKVSLKKYNMKEHKERVSALGITGFPAFIMVDNTATAATGSPSVLASFEEERTYENLLKFIREYE